MSLAKYRIAFNLQRHNAGRRGIGWELTFEQWLEWWGEDIERRGVGPDRLQMQRIADAGPYAIGNIKKGVPKQNSKTRVVVLRNRQGQQNRVTHQAKLNDLLTEDRSGTLLKELLDEDERELMRMFYPRSTMNFVQGD
ncbi:hypothetical protein [Burkholderia multivorans]|uniref:hypothetical protein n=1 Tax=Burkholderia multivorans TaxID=87883 RepID=UPI000D4275CD|nr:hypothetical protein [Burkholderia multivorans]PRE20310.1 hypothetical protein C6P78_03720 [Burkholderia multivorans]